MLTHWWKPPISGMKCNSSGTELQYAATSAAAPAGRSTSHGTPPLRSRVRVRVRVRVRAWARVRVRVSVRVNVTVPSCTVSELGFRLVLKDQHRTQFFVVEGSASHTSFV